MLFTNCIEKLTGLQDLEIKNIENTDNKIHIFCQLKRKHHKCPCCNAITNTIHDYREQVIKVILAFGKNCFIHLKKRRYRCSCGKRFAENNSFLPRYHRMTNRLSAYIINRLSDVTSFSCVAREVNLSVSTVIRIFDFVSYSPQKLPVALSINEFKGNTNGEKYQCILTDPVNKVVLDILPKRYESYLTKYFNSFSKEERSKVKYFVSDMWKPYSNISSIWFKNATQIVDKYHWIWQVIWAFETVRKQEQKKFSKIHRRYFKKSRQLLIKDLSIFLINKNNRLILCFMPPRFFLLLIFLKKIFLKSLIAETGI